MTYKYVCMYVYKDAIVESITLYANVDPRPPQMCTDMHPMCTHAYTDHCGDD